MLEYLHYLNVMNTTRETQDEAASASGVAGRAMDKVDEFHRRLGTIELALETLTRLGIKNGTFSMEEFQRMAREIDGEDGQLDGRRDTDKLRMICPKCKKVNNPTRTRCMWCNESFAGQRAVPYEI